MSEIRKITEGVPVIESVDESVKPSIYLEHGGTFYRAHAAEARKAIGLDGLACINGLLCVDTGGDDE